MEDVDAGAAPGLPYRQTFGGKALHREPIVIGDH
jgi:hypothetical protein